MGQWMTGAAYPAWPTYKQYHFQREVNKETHCKMRIEEKKRLLPDFPAKRRDGGKDRAKLWVEEKEKEMLLLLPRPARVHQSTVTSTWWCGPRPVWVGSKLLFTISRLPDTPDTVLV